MEKARQLFRKMGLGSRFHHHLQMVPVFLQKTAENDLLSKR